MLEDAPDSHEAIYDADFFAALREGARSSAAVIAPAIVDLVAPGRVIDVGCGTGIWLRAFAALGCDVWGVEGGYVPRDQLEIPESRLIERDLEEPLDLDGTWDLAMSLEVAEHLPSSSARTLVRGLAGLAPVVLFSAAIPGQGGHHHVNEQWPGYWVALFAEQDMTPIDCVRPMVWEDARVKWYYAQNALLFAREDALARLPGLRAQRNAVGTRVLPLVHPRLHVKRLA
jgi:SAM-dependent methyltransferase